MSRRPQASTTPALFAALASAAFCVSAGLPARAQSWNMYNSYTQSVSLPYIDAIPNPAAQNHFPTLSVTFPGGARQTVTMDTGSTGMAISANAVNTAGLTPLGPGSILYTSSNKIYTGTFYNMPVQIAGANGSTVTSSVQVLVVPDSGVAMMGIGFDRGGNPGVTQPTPAMNAFLNITAINGQPVSNMHAGYVVGSTGVTLGLTAAQSSGFAMVKLTPNTILPVNVWNRPDMGVAVNGSAVGTGGFLPDTGIAYMLMTPLTGISTTPCPPGIAGICAANGTSVQVALIPGLPAGLGAGYGFTVGSGGNPLMPAFVNQRDPDSTNVLSSTVSLNSGNAFFLGFNYLYDPVGGYVGYALSPLAGNDAYVSPLLGLQSNVALPNGFSTDYPVFLLGDTMLQQTGSGTFSGSIFGLGNNLGVSGGAIAFNGPIALGGGGFVVQPGASATINASLQAFGVFVAGQASLVNNGQITATVLNAGALTNNGTINGTLLNGGFYGGKGVINGSLINTGFLSPGNSIGTVTVNGNYLHGANGGYLAEVNPQGQSDRIAVSGATLLQGGTVVVLPQQTGGLYAPRTTYTILSSAGGLSGAYASVTGGASFLLPSLSYDANNVYLTLQVGGFGAAAQTPTQYAVGSALDLAAPNATGDFATVLGTLATQSSAQVLPLLTSLSGMNYSGFSSAMVQGAQLFMNNFLSQAGGGSPGGNRVALAEACDVACDTVSPPRWGAWGGALGGLGTVGANQGLGGLTYNVGGFAAGLDRAITDSFRAGVTVGYTAGTQWESGFTGQGFSNTVQAALYGSYAQGPLYLDGLVGYAYSANQLSRSIVVSGLAPRTAIGQTGANQVFGQVEGGWRFDLGGPVDAFVTPFARLQAYTGMQNGFTESGAQSLDLNVAAQTTSSLRSVLGAQLGGAVDLGWRDKLNAQLRLGWGHEYADISRPVAASFAGAPQAPFTTYGASPQRDGAVIGVAANTAIGEATSVYLRYEGTISGQDTAHALTAGVRMTW